MNDKDVKIWLELIEENIETAIEQAEEKVAIKVSQEMPARVISEAGEYVTYLTSELEALRIAITKFQGETT